MELHHSDHHCAVRCCALQRLLQLHKLQATVKPLPRPYLQQELQMYWTAYLQMLRQQPALQFLLPPRPPPQLLVVELPALSS
jgi:hypothetical protein